MQRGSCAYNLTGQLSSPTRSQVQVRSRDQKTQVSYTQTHDFTPGSYVGCEEAHKYVWGWCGGECPTNCDWPKQQVTRAWRKLWAEGGNRVLQKQPHKQAWKAAAGSISSRYCVNLVYIEMPRGPNGGELKSETGRWKNEQLVDRWTDRQTDSPTSLVKVKFQNIWIYSTNQMNNQKLLT